MEESSANIRACDRFSFVNICEIARFTDNGAATTAYYRKLLNIEPAVASPDKACPATTLTAGSGTAISNRITELTGIPATSTGDALIAALSHLNAKKVGLITP